MSVFDPGFANTGSAARIAPISRTNLNLACLANAGTLKSPGRYVIGRHEISGNTQVEALGSAQVTARDHSKVYAWEGASVTAQGTAIVIAADKAQIIALEYSNIVASDKVTVYARDNAVIEALGKAVVYASGNAHVRALESSVVHASGNSTVEAASLSGCTVYLSERAQIVGHTGNARIVQNT
jgi:hypothetical protein